MLVLTVLLQASLLVGFLLPPFLPRRSAVLPRCPRAYLTNPTGRGYFSPSRAACLVRMLNLRPGEVLLDPCGGVGVLPIEAALAQPGLRSAISLDNDPIATRIAREHAAAAAAAAGTYACAPVEVLCGDALAMTEIAAGSVDVALSDLPFGNRHAKLDVGALLAELWRVLSPGSDQQERQQQGSRGRGSGRALLVVKAKDRAKLERAARSHSQKKPWRCEGATEFASGGIDVVAVLFARAGPSAAAAGSSCLAAPAVNLRRSTSARGVGRSKQPDRRGKGRALAVLEGRIARLEAGEIAAAERLEALHTAIRQCMM